MKCADTVNAGNVGWVKEQSLAGIVNWFDYWLAQ